MRTYYHRRDVLRLAAGSALTSLGWPRSASWASDPGPAEDLRFVFYTDIHTRLEWGTPDALDLTARLINAQQADLILCGGDMITDGFQSSASAVAPRWDAYMEGLHKAIKSPVYSMIGNHDLVAAMPEDGSPASPDPRSEFRARMGVEHTYRTLEAAGRRIFILDCIEVTGDERKYRGYVSDSQLAWIRAKLQAVDQDTPIILMIHMPLLTTFYQATEGAEAQAPSNRVVVNNRQVLEAFGQHNLQIVLQGHLHVCEMIKWRKTSFITGGAICGKWWRGPWCGTEEGFCVVTMRRDSVALNYVDLGWDAKRPAGA